MTVVVCLLLVDLVHLGLDVCEHAVTVVTPGCQHAHNVSHIDLPERKKVTEEEKTAAKPDISADDKIYFKT